MSDLTKHQSSQSKTICNDCAFHTLLNHKMQCTHPEESDINCSAVIFCNSFQPIHEVDSPCVSFDDEK